MSRAWSAGRDESGRALSGAATSGMTGHRALSGFGRAAGRDVASRLTPRPPPSLSRAQTAFTIRLSWEPAESTLPITAYRVYRIGRDGNSTLIGETRSDKREYFLDLSSSAEARYCVTAVNPAGESACSEEAAVAYAKMA